MSIYHVTHYSHNGKARKYQTKALTPMHEYIRVKYPKAYTVRCDPSIPFPFGVWSEVIFRENNTPVKPLNEVQTLNKIDIKAY